jgi:dolichol-phosphate mannosyltransferase
MAGLEMARGDAIVTMDCDLQHPPTLLPQMVEAWQKGYKVVQTIREETTDASRGKRITSRVFYRLMQALSDTPITPGAADFQLLDRAALRDLLRLSDSRPFLRGMVSWIGHPRIAIPYKANARQHGTSSYTWNRMFLLAVDAITAFSTKPLRLAFYAAFFSSVMMMIYLVYIAVKFVQGEVLQGWTSLAFVILIFGTIQLITLGIMGEYIGRIYEQARNRPRYLVQYSSPTRTTNAEDPGIFPATSAPEVLPD